VRHNKADPLMTARGQPRTSPPWPLRQLSPAADIPSHGTICEKCQRTKSLRDSGGVWLVHRCLKGRKIVATGRRLEDRVSLMFIEHAPRRLIGHKTISQLQQKYPARTTS
jgi:hypothetical protein